MYSKVLVRIVSLAPLLLHNVQLSDPLNEHATRLKELSGIKKKTPEIHRRMAEIEFVGSMYLDAKGVPVIPGEMLEACIINGAKKNKLGTAFKSAILVDGAFPLEYKGPKAIEGLLADPAFRDRRAVSVNMSKVMRTRPRFDNWALSFELHFLGEQVKPEEVKLALENAGRMCGLGDYRPKFGRFEIEKWTVTK